ncbi:MAG: amidohydrolase, partial [Deltaproteobacteria bacterium]|nr:amidohydrolase [Deltaproteobacteria bacterium]
MAFRMKKILQSVVLVILIFVLLGVVSVAVFRYYNRPPESLVFINGKVLTMDSDNSIADAVALRWDRIAAVGSNDKIKGYINNESIVIDLEGKTLVPGFVDAHSHFPGSGLSAVGVDLNSPPIGKITNITQAIEALRNKASEEQEGNWIYGFGYDDTLLTENRHLNRIDLDKVSEDHPVFVSHISGHLGVANTLALRQAGITADTPDPEGGVIRKDAEGRPTGILEETGKDEMLKMAMDFSVWEFLAMIKRANRDYTSTGVTTAQSGLCPEGFLKGLSLFSGLGLIPVRLMVWPDDKLGDKIISGEFNAEKHNSEMFQVGAVKLIADGSIQGYTGYLSKPYHVPFKGDKEYRGYPVINREELVSLVKKFHKAGMQLAVHGNGDAAIDDIIYAYSEAQKELPRGDSRHMVIHSQMARYDQLDAMKNWGIIPSFYSAHTYYWGDRHWDIFMGPERARRMSPARSASERGIRFTIHLDTPVVPMNPLLLVWSAVNRISTSGRVIGEEERISAVQALRAVTIDAAWQGFQEDNRGSI